MYSVAIQANLFHNTVILQIKQFGGLTGAD